ncbi:class I SAM-dependent methyltransferase [Paenibacillus thalictri]|uniref:Class I SAM-dependent methyltransferase n=1 Tax=Paenibacillus thalictri TaxID=2527873 RepID=A0A4Q9DQB3_9BACL|nr:class I SAM-dependent methyltransferase [Paenibacillus thalictri]TBL76486.1 class I SAM-dependent methyltransferase [Paenibacillus thalictri]
MNYFWESVIKPVLELSGAKRIVEIGAFNGKNTVNLLNYCRQKGGIVQVIDPLPLFDVQKFRATYGSHLMIYESISLQILPLLHPYDAILIDGDHNWYTVYHELKAIESLAVVSGKRPLIFLHDTGWPYGRRDAYFNPKQIPDKYRKPYAKKGMTRGVKELTEHGLNSDAYNAVYEGGTRNGVLTAVEDFLKQSPIKYDFHQSHDQFGLGLLTPHKFPLKKLIRYFR